MENIFITGASGYIGTRLIKALQKDGNYHIKALVRKGSEQKLPPGCEIVFGDVLSAVTYMHEVEPASIFVHLVGVAHPSPAKKEQFQKIDLRSIEEASRVASKSGVSHFVYISVSQYPSEIMKDYQLVRAKGEALLSEAGIPSSFIRPWYVLGPGHWWPLILLPFYWLFSLVPSYKEKLRQQGLVTIQQMIDTLVFAIKNPPANGISVYYVPDIREINSMNVNLSPAL